MIQRLGGFNPMHKIMGRLYGSVSNNASQEEVVEMLQQIRDNLGVDDFAWGASAGMIRNLRSGYSENKANTVVSDYLWSGVRAR